MLYYTLINIVIDINNTLVVYVKCEIYFYNTFYLLRQQTLMSITGHWSLHRKKTQLTIT